MAKKRYIELRNSIAQDTIVCCLHEIPSLVSALTKGLLEAKPGVVFEAVVIEMNEEEYQALETLKETE